MANKISNPVKVGTVLLYTAAIYQATQYARVFHAIDPTSAWSDLSGLLAGVVVNVSLAFSASRLPRIRAKSARRMSYTAFWALLILTPAFIAPVNYQTMGDLWKEVPFVRGMLALLSAAVVDIAIILVAFADGSLLPADASQTAGSATQPAKPATQPADSAKVYACEWPGCGAEFDKPQSYSAHVMHHRRKEDKILAEKQLERRS